VPSNVPVWLLRRAWQWYTASRSYISTTVIWKKDLKNYALCGRCRPFSTLEATGNRALAQTLPTFCLLTGHMVSVSLNGTSSAFNSSFDRRVTDVVHDVAEALKATVPTERIYLMSLGSHQGNAHVHWHVAPLPPGVPYERQQFHAVMAENGILEVTREEQTALAARVRSALQDQRRT
jgi:diadenosine tetraphosphate (Ap4A) HIT family hydrolase